MNRRTLIILVIILILGAGGFFVYRRMAAPRSSSAANLQTDTVQRGEMVVTVNAAGNIASPQSATLVWRINGTVGKVNISVGDVVTGGAVLMELDPSSLDPSIIKAQADLISAQQDLKARLAPGAAAQQLEQARMAVVQAEEAVTATTKSLRYVLNPVSQGLYDAVRDTQVSLDTAKANAQLANVSQDVQDYNGNVWITDWYFKRYQDAKAKYDANTGSLELKDALDRAWSDYQAYADKQAQRQLRIQTDQANKSNTLAQAQAAYDKAVGNLNYALQGPNQDNVRQLTAQLALDKANLAKAQEDLARLEADPDPMNVAAARAQVAAAQATVDQVRLVAPFTGTVVAMDNELGDSVSTGQTAITLADVRTLEVNVDVSEVDVNRISTGQEVTLSLDAVPGRTFNGRVAQVGSIGRAQQGVVTFPVKVVIPEPDPALKSGMTAAVSIVAERRQNALLVPNRAIRVTGNQRTVTVLFEGQQIPVPVTIGLSNETMTEVTGGSLKEGDAVLINTSTQTTTGGGGVGFGGFLGGGGGFRGP